MDGKKYHPSLNLFISSLSKVDAHILELACGPGNITKYLLSQNPSLDILVTDLSPAMLELAKENNPNASIQMLDCRSILELNEKYDAILCGFGLPYISKEEAILMIRDASISLNKNGLIYISTMEDDYDKSGFKASSSDPNEGLHMYFHEAEYLVNAMSSNGFEIIDLSRVQYLDDKGEDVVDLIIIGKK